MSEINPACARMTAGCPPTADCRLQAESCRVAETADGKASRYVYACRTCGAKWLVDFPMVQPTFDRFGRIAEAPAPRVEQFRTS